MHVRHKSGGREDDNAEDDDELLRRTQAYLPHTIIILDGNQ